MIKKIDIKLRDSKGGFLIHDSRSDVRALMKVCNCLIEKVNELIDIANHIKAERG